MPYGIVTLEDYEGTGEIALFGDNWAQRSGYFNKGCAIFVTGKVQERFNSGRFDLNITNIQYLEEMGLDAIESITITASLDQFQTQHATELLSVIKDNQGDVDLYFFIKDPETQQCVRLNSMNTKVNVSADLINYIEAQETLEYNIN